MIGVSKDMLSVNYFYCSKSFLYQLNLKEIIDGHKVEISLATLIYGEIIGFPTSVFVCLNSVIISYQTNI